MKNLLPAIRTFLIVILALGLGFFAGRESIRFENSGVKVEPPHIHVKVVPSELKVKESVYIHIVDAPPNMPKIDEVLKGEPFGNDPPPLIKK